MNIGNYIQEEVHNLLHRQNTLEAKILNGIIAFLIIISIALIPVHYIPDIEGSTNLIHLFEKITVTIFSVEYFLRIWSAKQPLRYVFSTWGLIDLISILPFYLAQMDLIADPQIFLSLRILRIFKLGKIYEMERRIMNKNALTKHGRFQALETETIQYVVQKHWLTFAGQLSLCISIITAGIVCLILITPISFYTAIMLSAFLFTLALFLFMKLWLDFNYDLIYVTNFRIIQQNREIFGAILNDVTYESITNIRPDDSGILNWIFGFGDIIIDTAAQKGAIIFSHSEHPHKAVDVISYYRQKKNTNYQKMGTEISPNT